MRNLKLDVLKVNNLTQNNVSRYLYIDDTKSVYLNNNKVHYINNGTEQILAEDITSIDWVPIENTIYMGNGNIFNCYNVHTNDDSIIEIPDGYIVYDWNPSQDRVALVDETGLLKIVILDVHNSMCMITNEYQLAALENSPFINIGWGSRETQFKGSEGKNAKKPTDEDSENVDNNSIRIAWREEGDMFAVSFIRDGKRIFKIFSSECEFLFECEYRPGLGAEIAWKPDGSLLAVDSDTPQGRKLMFFEKNGLYRFDLKLTSEVPVKKIRWNTLGDILMIWQQDASNSEINLWTYSNCTWHLKQSLMFKNKNVNNVEWSDKKTLEVITTDKLLQYTFKWTTHASNSYNYDISTNNPENLGSLAVIDGKNLRITNTREHIIPPPFSSYNIQFENPVNHLTFGVKSNILVAILSDYTVKIIELTSEGYEEKFSKKLESNFPFSLNHFVFDDRNSALYCFDFESQDECKIKKIEIDFGNKTYDVKTYDTGVNYNTKMIDLLRVSEQLDLGFHLGLCVEDIIKVCHDNNTNLEQIEIITMEESSDNSGLTTIIYVENKYNVFSLKNQRFYYNGSRVKNNITSYLYCLGYLLLTTTDNTLICIKLCEKSFSHLEKNNFSNFYTRSIPSGAILISAVPGTRKVILQVPRGELEVINPRVLTIDEIDRLLEEKRHYEAYMIMRTDRINPNLLYDINPKRFLDDVEDFIKNINNCDYIDVFLTNLQNTNVTQELYENCFDNSLPEQLNKNKVYLIADKFVEVMKKLDPDYYLQSIVIAYQCKGTNDDLKQALLHLNAARIEEKQGKTLRIPVDDTLKYLLQLTPVEKLYEIALVLDNMELTIWVLSKSQMDPSEYIPFLREISEMEPTYRNFRINQHTKNYEEAFKFIINCDNVLEEMKEFIKKHCLYHLIMKYIEPTNQWYNALLEFYADYLLVKSRFKEGGIIYLRLGLYKNALRCFCEGTQMKEALTTLSLMNLPNYDAEINLILKCFTEKLVDNKMFKEAAYIYDNILKNYEDAVSVLLKGNNWSDAYYLAIKNNRNDLIETELKPALSSYADVLFNVFNETEQEFIKFKTRLQKLRKEKIAQLERGFHMDDENFIDMPECVTQNIDLESVVSSNYSQASQKTRSSQRSTSTARKQKRIARKILSMKEGSAFENIAIIRQLYLLIENTQNLAQKVNDTCTYLFMFPEFSQRGIELQSIYGKIIDFMKTSKEIIWPADMTTPPETATVESRAYRYNIEHLDFQFRYPPADFTNNWKTLFTV